MTETDETTVDIAVVANHAGIAARSTLGYADLSDFEKSTVNDGIHSARSKIRGGLTTEQVNIAVEKATLRHNAMVATLEAFRDGTAPDPVYLKAAEWDQV